MGMKKLIPIVILATPAMILFLSMKLGIHFIVSNAADFRGSDDAFCSGSRHKSKNVNLLGR
jgi:hypothetical protein